MVTLHKPVPDYVHLCGSKMTTNLFILSNTAKLHSAMHAVYAEVK